MNSLFVIAKPTTCLYKVELTSSWFLGGESGSPRSAVADGHVVTLIQESVIGERVFSKSKWFIL